MTARATARPRQTPTTPRLLQILSILIVLLTVAVGVSAYTIVSRAHSTVTAMTEEAGPAVIAAGRAQVYLAKADAAHAYHSVRNNPKPSRLLLGQPYLSARKTGAKQLGQALADNTAGSAGASLLRSAEKGLDGYARLPFAAHFMHNASNGILHKIGHARLLNRGEFNDRRSSAWLSPAVLALYLVPAITLLGLLVQSQRFLRLRFRRRLNPPLLAATGLIVVLTGWTAGQVVHTHYALEKGETSLTRLTTLMQARTLVAEADAAELRALAAGPNRWFGERIDELVATPLTEPVAPPVGAGKRIASITTTKMSVGVVLDQWNPTTLEGQHVIEEVRRDFEQFMEADSARDEDKELGEVALDKATAELHTTAVALDDSLSQLIALEKERFDAWMQSAARRFGLGVGIPLLAIGSVVLTLGGLGKRLSEYWG